MTNLEAQDYRFCPQCFEAYPLPAHDCPEHKVDLVRLRYPEGSLKGRLIDRKYVILDLLGRGGMGVVYRARQMPIKREVAFKVLNREFLKHPASVKRFIREASAASMLRSRFSAIVHDFGLAREGFLYFTMELARGNLLSDAIQSSTLLDVEQACLVATDICRSLEEAHGHGIVHRDLKPSNIMLLLGEDRVLAKVLDFGTARLIGPRQGERITDPGKVFGTPEYMSPEQAMGEDVGPAADLYSLGVLLYEMVTGVLPFTGKTHTHLLLKQIREKPQSLRVVIPELDVPAPLDDLVATLLQKNPKRRLESAREVRRALAEILHDYFPHAWESSPAASPPTRLVDVVTAPEPRGPSTLASFGALTPEMICDEGNPEDLGRRTLELGAAVPDEEFVSTEAQTGKAVTRQEPRVRKGPPRPVPASPAASDDERWKLLPAVAIFLLFCVLVAGGWRVMQFMMDGRSTIAPKAAVEDNPEVEVEVREHESATSTSTSTSTSTATATGNTTETAKARPEPVEGAKARPEPVEGETRRQDPAASPEPPNPNMEGFFFLSDAAIEEKPDSETGGQAPGSDSADVVEAAVSEDVIVAPPPERQPKRPPRAVDPGFSMDDLQ